jgi:hypothetical protein
MYSRERAAKKIKKESTIKASKSGQEKSATNAHLADKRKKTTAETNAANSDTSIKLNNGTAARYPMEHGKEPIGK